MLKEVFEQAAAAINGAKSVVLTIHVQPDGDALGSLLAMYHFLRKSGKTTCATWGEPIKIPDQYKWLPEVANITNFESCIDADLLIALDCANEHRLGLMEQKLSSFKSIINIDHHVDNSSFGTINILDFSASATCEIVYELLKFMKADIDSDIASLLYTGIVTDTGRFQYQNTTAKTLRVAADLVDLGAVPNDIFKNIYENISFASLKLLAKVLGRAEYVKESGLVYSYILNEDLSKAGVSVADTENFIDYLRTAREASVAAIFKEMADGKLRVSLRSKGLVDVGAIAREQDGGGHRNAAGATLDMTIDEAAKWLSDRIKALHF
ncbi:MAG: bifunctional oligoribonuclease/PAP phosphatase NrnA [Actinomycetota bacterium]|nr:bifunctional oligoribonuclease/PAP phosphatase NrnA [Actinomycetota bacterium]